MVLDDGTIELPIKFTAEKAGHYPCKIILEAADDIRVYQVECTVNPPGCRYDHSCETLLSNICTWLFASCLLLRGQFATKKFINYNKSQIEECKFVNNAILAN